MSRALCALAEDLAARSTDLEPKVAARLARQGELHGRVADELAAALAPEERVQTEDLERHARVEPRSSLVASKRR